MHTASVIRLIGMHCLYRYSLLKKSSEDTKHMGMRASSVHACWSIRAEIQAESWHFCFDNDILNIIRTLMIDCVCFYVAKFGTPNTRLETLFQYIPDVRRLGLWHYKMTTDPSLGVAQQRQSWRHHQLVHHFQFFSDGPSARMQRVIGTVVRQTWTQLSRKEYSSINSRHCGSNCVPCRSGSYRVPVCSINSSGEHFQYCIAVVSLTHCPLRWMIG